MPDVPTIAEAGGQLRLATFDIDTWFGIFAPAQRRATARLNKAFVGAPSAEAARPMASLYAEPMAMAPEPSPLCQGELAKYEPLVKASGARVE
jgi:tripartite-type tricarboxylate transporter receptor subunit TctC